eukprot:3189951-Prorocentrum_lima.AAC.1
MPGSVSTLVSDYTLVPVTKNLDGLVWFAVSLVLIACPSPLGPGPPLLLIHTFRIPERPSHWAANVAWYARGQC